MSSTAALRLALVVISRNTMYYCNIMVGMHSNSPVKHYNACAKLTTTEDVQQGQTEIVIEP